MNDYPRLTSMGQFFSKTASGASNMPTKNYNGSPELFVENYDTKTFYNTLLKTKRVFGNHFFSSIPYVLDEYVRLGTTICRYSKSKKNIYVYTLGSAEAILARTLTKVEPNITTFSCSPTKENYEVFKTDCNVKKNYFKVAPYFAITNERIKELVPNYEDFDIIMEDTTFQMYSNNRDLQIGNVINKLKPNGIVIFLEKFQTDSVNYNARETQKDSLFKSQFFPKNQILKKKQKILNTMNTEEVTLDDFQKTVKKYFSNLAITWNSGNFSILVASNDKQNFETFINAMDSPYIPKEYQYLFGLPIQLIGKARIKFRRHGHDS